MISLLVVVVVVVVVGVVFVGLVDNFIFSGASDVVEEDLMRGFFEAHEAVGGRPEEGAWGVGCDFGAGFELVGRFFVASPPNAEGHSKGLRSRSSEGLMTGIFHPLVGAGEGEAGGGG